MNKKKLELEVNSGKGFCRTVSFSTTNNQCPVIVNGDTTARLTNSSLDFTNIDKVYISGVIHAYFKMNDQTVQVQNSTTALMSQLTTNSDTSSQEHLTCIEFLLDSKQQFSL